MEDLWSTSSPWIHRFAGKNPDEAYWTLPPQGTSFVARLDGEKMTDLQGVFEEFSRGLRFPAYFGWNWPAFSECLRDLAWIGSENYLLVISGSQFLLSDEPEEMNTFMKISEEAGRTRSRMIRQPATSFNIVLT
ncbi:barstar family protein [Kitasatospora sp. NBC_01287]|uniref:barstar family protein n=1 Tax=Kitasatospora sp. NBC_01287 TaxID=2903573 RepID=UPI002258985C|nr:barstar family protein [Kitasatospora sp. NBC_01287]MCX4747440.1 barstar family protein [Kitasatospora sp. NBC_01287]